MSGATVLSTTAAVGHFLAEQGYDISYEPTPVRPDCIS